MLLYNHHYNHSLHHTYLLLHTLFQRDGQKILFHKYFHPLSISLKTISNAKQKFKGNIHLVIVDNSRSLTHFCLNPEFRIRKELIDDIVKGAKSFDGVQIDFE